MQETRRAGRTCFTAAGSKVFCCGSEKGGQHGVGIASESPSATVSHTLPSSLISA
ncbi:unnamed protein product [Pylaiella littoralis]